MGKGRVIPGNMILVMRNTYSEKRDDNTTGANPTVILRSSLSSARKEKPISAKATEKNTSQSPATLSISLQTKHTKHGLREKPSAL
jgi:hypothetical protein